MSPQTRPNILLVEDEPLLADVVCDYLYASGYAPVQARTGTAAIDALAASSFDLVVLDLSLPGLDGLSVLASIRKDSPTLPVIIVSARSSEDDRLRGFSVGADDYVCKPFSPRELMARVAAVLRRASAPQALGMRVHEDGVSVSAAGITVELTPGEARLLDLLICARGTVLSRSILLDRMHDADRDVSDRTIDTHVKNIRKKLADGGIEGDWIKSVYGVGYRFSDAP